MNSRGILLATAIVALCILQATSGLWAGLLP